MSWRRRLRWLRKLLLAALWLRRYTPAPWERSPGPYDGAEGGLGDTGGGGWYRPPHRRQDPSVDPREPGGGESSSRGEDHGWSGCTMSAAAMALAFAKLGGTYWGGDMRHHQSDLEGGTDLYDARQAFAAYGEDLVIRSGAGWSGLQADRDAGRFLVVQGSGNVPGSATFDGGHACALGPETDADGRWLWGDPLAGGWQWVSASSIRTWMEAWAGSGLAYARTVAHPPSSPPPDPEPPPPVDTTPYAARDLEAARTEGYGRGQADGRQAGATEALDAVFRSWSPGAPRPPLAPWDASSWDVEAWGLTPYPLAGLVASRTPAAWDTWPVSWTGALWRDVTPEPEAGSAWGEVAWDAPWR